MEQVADGVYAVPVLGARVWLLTAEPLTLVDTGWPGSGRAILRALDRLGLRPEALQTVVLTHYHPDHLGALPWLLARCPHLRVAIHASEAPYLASPAALPNPAVRNERLLHALLALGGPLLRPRRSYPAAFRLLHGAAVPNRPDVRVIHLPGHTPGSIGLHLPAQGVVLAGDAFERRGGRLGPPSGRFTADMTSAWRSIARLGALDFDTLCLSHWAPLRRHAAAAVRALTAQQP